MPVISAIVSAVAAVGTAVGGAIATGVGALTASAGSFFTASGLLGALGKGVLSLGLSYGLQALAGGKKQKQPIDNSPNLVFQVGGAIPRQVAFGRVGTKGHLVDQWVHGQGNSSVSRIIVLSDGRIGGLTGLIVGEKKETLASLATTHGETQRFTDATNGATYLDIRIWDGRDGQSGPSAFLIAQGIPDFAAADRMAGMAFAVVTVNNLSNHWSGLPELIFEIDGYCCYDPRKDGSRTGSGSHRWDNPMTWETTRNPIIQTYNYLRGVKSEGKAFIGTEFPEYELFVDEFIASANVCDEVITLADSTTEPRYRCDIVITAGDPDHRSSLQPILQSCGGALRESVGQLGVIAGAAQASVATITDNDIDWTSGVSWQYTRSRTDRFNEIHGQFIDPKSQYNANSYAPIIDAVASGIDGARMAVELSFGAVTSSTQAQRLASQMQRASRLQAKGKITLGIHMLRLELGDWVTWQSDRYNQTLVYRISSWAINSDGRIVIDVEQISAAIYGTSASILTPVSTPPSSFQPPDGISTVQNFNVQADVAAGSSRPVTKCTWTPIDDERVSAVIIEYRPVGMGGLLTTRVTDNSPLDGSYTIDPAPTDHDYEYRATIRTIPPRFTGWTAWKPLAAIATPPIDFTQFTEGTQAVIQQAYSFNDEIRARLNLAAASLGDTAVRNHLKIVDLKAETASGFAAVRDEAVVQSTAIDSIAQRTSVVEASFTALSNEVDGVQSDLTTLAADVTTVTNALAASDAAFASQITTIQSNVTTVQSTATAANNAASNAQSTATAANNAASNAQSAADAAQSTATTAQATATSAASTAATASSAASTVATEVDAIFGGDSASALFRVTASAATGSAYSLIELQARQGTGGTARSTGLTIGSNNSIGFVEISASQFFMTDPQWNSGTRGNIFTWNNTHGAFTFNVPVRFTSTATFDAGIIDTQALASNAIANRASFIDAGEIVEGEGGGHGTIGGVDHFYAVNQRDTRTSNVATTTGNVVHVPLTVYFDPSAHKFIEIQFYCTFRTAPNTPAYAPPFSVYITRNIGSLTFTSKTPPVFRPTSGWTASGSAIVAATSTVRKAQITSSDTAERDLASLTLYEKPTTAGNYTYDAFILYDLSQNPQRLTLHNFTVIAHKR